MGSSPSTSSGLLSVAGVGWDWGRQGCSSLIERVWSGRNSRVGAQDRRSVRQRRAAGCRAACTIEKDPRNWGTRCLAMIISHQRIRVDCCIGGIRIACHRDLASVLSVPPPDGVTLASRAVILKSFGVRSRATPRTLNAASTGS